MATCKDCLKEDVCEIRHRVSLIDDVCEHFIYKNHIEMSMCEENRLRILCDERLQEIHKLNQVCQGIILIQLLLFLIGAKITGNVQLYSETITHRRRQQAI